MAATEAEDFELLEESELLNSELNG